MPTTAMPLRTLRALRLERLMSLRALAAEAGVSPRTLLTTELGRRRPSLATIRKLSTALDVRPESVREFAAVIEEEGTA